MLIFSRKGTILSSPPAGRSQDMKVIAITHGISILLTFYLSGMMCELDFVLHTFMSECVKGAKLLIILHVEFHIVNVINILIKAK